MTGRDLYVAGVILAGGASTRMGVEKALLPLAGRPLIEHVAARLRPQVDRIVISANGDPGRFRGCGAPVVPDRVADRGPLQGVLAGMLWARAAGAGFVLTAPCDTPYLPADLADRLRATLAEAGAPVAVATSAGRDHYAVSLQPVALAEALEAWLAAGNRSLHGWLASHRAARAGFEAAPDPFFNINAPADLARAATHRALDRRG